MFQYFEFLTLYKRSESGPTKPHLMLGMWIHPPVQFTEHVPRNVSSRSSQQYNTVGFEMLSATMEKFARIRDMFDDIRRHDSVKFLCQRELLCVCTDDVVSLCADLGYLLVDIDPKKLITPFSKPPVQPQMLLLSTCPDCPEV